MQRYTEDTHSQIPAYMDEDPQGDWVKYDDAQATIARLTAERDQARATAAAAYDRAANVLDTHGDGLVNEALGQQICCSGQMCGCMGSDVGSFLQHLIRALATEPGTIALADMLDAETRACAELFSHPEAKMVRDRILARIDQRKGSS